MTDTTINATCPDCGGWGRIDDILCPGCGGSGEIAEPPQDDITEEH